MTLDGFVTLWLVQPAAEQRQTCCFVSGLFWCLFLRLFLRLWCLRLASVSLRPAAAREAMNAPPPWGRPVARCAWIASSQRATRRPPRWRLFLAAASRSPHGASKAVSAPPPQEPGGGAAGTDRSEPARQVVKQTVVHAAVLHRAKGCGWRPRAPWGTIPIVDFRPHTAHYTGVWS